MKPGKVYIVGAGPGDYGLTTLRAVECLEKADVVIYDRLLDTRLLEHARQDAEKIYVGKAAAEHTLPQSEINRLLVQKANEGKSVVRLKGGDPFVFGRGGEEAEALVKNGLEFEVVPGVTSAVAVPAYAGIPVTHRKLAASFAVITGHEDPSKSESSIRWDKLATGVDTLVFLMGMQNLAEIAARLMASGRPGETPAAVITDGAGPRQKTVTGTLHNIVSLAREAGLGPPGILVVGEVVRLRQSLRWFDNQPLFGKRILVTRARHQASVLSKMLAAKGALPVELPVISIQKLADNYELQKEIVNLPRYQWLVFTSGNGVEAFFEVLAVLKLDARALARLKIAVIGAATAAALKQNGLTADCQPAVFTSRGLLDEMAQRNISGQAFLLPRADIADAELSEGLIALGARVRDVVAYRTSPDETAAAVARSLLAGPVDVVTFTSSSTVANLTAVLESQNISLNGARIACIGPKTAEAAARAGLRPHIVAREQTIPGMVAAIEDYYRKEKE